MKVLNSEGIATHTGRESCVVHREVYGEALTGVWLAKIGSGLNLRGIFSDTTHVCFVR